MKKAILILIAFMFFVPCFSQTIIPMPIYTDNEGGYKHDPMVIVSLYMAVNLFLIIGLAIRLLIIKNHKDFKKQSVLKNVFYNLNSLDYLEMKPYLNLLTIMVIFINVAALLITTTFFIYNLFNKY